MRSVRAVALLLVLFGCLGCVSLDRSVRRLGFTPLALPSAGEVPGKVILVTSSDPLVPEPVCSYGTFSGLPRINTNSAASFQASQRLGGPFFFRGQYEKRLKLGAEAKVIRSVSVSLTNVEVEEISWDDINAGIKSQKAGCATSIRQGKERRRRLGVVVRALRADGRFKVDFESGASLSAEARAELLKHLAIELGAGPTSVSGTEIVGSRLYWGVLLNEDLVREAENPLPDLPPPRPGDDWDDARFDKAKENIRWIFSNGRASSDYALAREAKFTKLQSLLHAQRHNPDARGTILDYGELRALRLLETLGR